MTVIIDYGVGNLFSLACSLRALGEEVLITGKAGAILAARRVVLPGVGAFGNAMNKLRETGLDEVVLSAAARGLPVLGICLGMQLLFQHSEEFGLHTGLGLLQGQIRPLQPALAAAGCGYKVPHMGWNALQPVKPECPLLRYVKPGEAVYYVHSYYAQNCAGSLAAHSEYGVMVPGVVWRGNVFGTQFHPEKSGEVGLRILRAFTGMEAPPC